MRLFLYKLINTVNDKVYIGVTKHPETRFAQHLSKGSTCTKIRNAIQCHGKEKFSMVVLCEGNEATILKLEVAAIDYYNSISNGYNLIKGHPKSGGFKSNPETCQKISQSLQSFYERNTAKNKGTVVAIRKDDKPLYARGFWFPNSRTARRALGLSRSHLRRVSSPDVVRKEKNQDKLSKLLGRHPCFLESAIRFKKEVRKRARTNYCKEKHHCFGKTGKEAARSKPVVINGVAYAGTMVAVRLTGMTRSMIQKRLYKGSCGYEYYDEQRHEHISVVSD